ncbi:MAG: hypothetical protein JWN48_4869 [Myxococcaceae bacterium]|nr:hypothetical protein [Myxococcaceae bacterium]
MGEAVWQALQSALSAHAGDLTVRIAGPSDTEALSELFDAYRVFYGQQSDRERARRFLSEREALRESVVLVAEATDGCLLGFTQLYPSFTSVGTARIWILNDMFVAAEARRKGLARALVGAAAELARRTEASALALSTAETNQPAQALYESLGFVRDNVFRQYRLSLDRVRT